MEFLSQVLFCLPAYLTINELRAENEMMFVKKIEISKQGTLRIVVNKKLWLY